MEIVTTFNFLAIFIAFVGRITRKEKACFLFAIIMLTIFYSIRTDYGNDLPAYISLYDYISHISYSNLTSIIKDSIFHFEPGWLILNYLFKPFGWQTFITFLTIFQFCAIYKLITRYTDAKYYWLVFAIYILNSSLLLTSLSMLRQAFAMHIVLFSVPFILNKRFIIAGSIILLATTFHTSAYVAFLLIPLWFVTKVNAKLLSIIFLLLFVFCFIAKHFVGDILNAILISSSFERYQVYENGQIVNGSGLGVVLKLFLAMWLLFNYAKDDNSKYLTIIYCIYVSFTPFIYAIQMIARVGSFFEFISIPILSKLTNLKKDFVGFGILTLLILIYVLSYFNFFSSPVWRDAFSVYKTIFD